VSRLEKLRRKLAENPRAIRFEELVRVLRDLGFAEARSRGSHHLFRPVDSGPSILIVKPHAGHSFCAEVDVRKVVALLAEKESSNEE
jgi:predicted RNA binding protein YcfA (HicA-like mRNA interferase family)